jgi:DNA polymerase-3 subunit delta
MAATARFIFICGADDFLVGRVAKERFATLAADVADEFSREVINGFANNVGEVAGAVNRLREAVQTISMFGGRRVVWLKDVNFLADSLTGRAEGTLRLVEDLQQILEGVNPEETGVLISAAPIDRRRAFPKWCEKTADYALVGGEGDEAGETLLEVAIAEARSLGAEFAPGAAELLLAKVGANPRLIIEETRKLAAFALPVRRDPAESSGAAPAPEDGPVTITEAHVAELTPNVAEGDFFEVADAFFSGDLPRALAALRQHFFVGGDARPVLAALQNRNRLLLQVRALADAGEVRVGPRGVDGLARAQAGYAARFVGATEKSTYNLFTQHPFYLGKLVGGAKLPSLRRLIDNQQDFLVAFEELIRRPENEAEEVLREMTVRCLAA